MDTGDCSRLLGDSLDSLQVTFAGGNLNWVGSDWEDLDYTPGYSKFYYIIQGKGRLRVGDQSWEPGAGDLCLMPEGINQGYGTTSPPEYTKYWCHFSVRLAGVSLFDLVRPSWIVRVLPQDDMLIRSIFDRVLLGCSDRNNLSALLDSRAALLQLVAWYLSAAGMNRPGLALPPGLDKVARGIAWMKANLGKPVGVASMAAELAMTPAAFSRLFSRHMGMPPVRYLVRLRLESAAQLLGSSDLPLIDIASRCGFSDEFYFSRLFRQQYGQSPSAWRKLQRSLPG